ncbi:DALR anticodon-binding domain-containing protein [Lipingzhangella sp. LS1_29]|uniref:DALR anticodon-binding domain-containing protein n=1 Tax=Lipingzhangella rawalii TaxID=2055835 RepID=A0ABU2H5W6_9ACTN|nr:DALR anticodon-binding domain-containing protein [Lipingzhangella rawalii]
MPDPQPRWADSGDPGIDCVSALPQRLAAKYGSFGTRGEQPQQLARVLADGLNAVPGIAEARVVRGSLLALRMSAPVRGSLVYGVAEGWNFLAEWPPPAEPGAASAVSTPRAGRDGPPVDDHGWPCSPLYEADDLATATRWARADTRERIAHFRATAPKTPPGQRRVDTWRDPCRDASPHSQSSVELGVRGEVPRLLATVGEANARFALCRGSSDRPQPATQTGPGLPAVPTAEHPGVWSRHTFANPAFSVRYAHAHAWTTVHRWARDAGHAPLTIDQWQASPAVAELGSVQVAPLLGCLFDGPGTLATAHRRARPHTLVRYLERLCANYHEWRDPCPVIPATDDTDSLAIAARLTVCAAVAGVLATGVFLLGVSAPTRL